MRAMAEGTRFGRRPKLTKHQAREALKRVAAGEPLRKITLSYNVDHSTINATRPRLLSADSGNREAAIYREGRHS
jgi:hypothetical protein